MQSGDKMKLTQQADCALRITYILAKNECYANEAEQGKTAERPKIMDAKTVSEGIAIPISFTLKTLRALMLSGLVDSYKGTNGGYTLSKIPAEITLLDVIEAIDGTLKINRCLESDYECSRNGHNKSICRIHRILGAANKHLGEKLSSVTFEDVCNDTMEIEI